MYTISYHKEALNANLILTYFDINGKRLDISWSMII